MAQSSTKSSEQETAYIMQPSPILRTAHSFNSTTDFPSYSNMDPTPVALCNPELRGAFVSNRRPTPTSKLRSGHDNSLDNNSTYLLSPPISPIQDRQLAIQADNSSAAFVGNGQFPVGNATQYVDGTQYVPMSLDGNNNIFQSSVTGSERAQDLRMIRATPPELPNMNYSESGAEQPPGHTSLLHLAVASGNADTLRLLLRNFDMSIDMRDAAGYTPLERAVLYGFADLVAILLEHGIDVASEDEVAASRKSLVFGHASSRR
jgi:hypothetical protein